MEGLEGRRRRKSVMYRRRKVEEKWKELTREGVVHKRRENGRREVEEEWEEREEGGGREAIRFKI